MTIVVDCDDAPADGQHQSRLQATGGAESRASVFSLRTMSNRKPKGRSGGIDLDAVVPL